MPANTTPIFTATPDIQWISSVLTSNATADLTSGTIYLCFTADATNGGYVQRMRFKALPGGNNIASVARVWINNGSTTGTATNNILFDEATLPATTGVTNAAVAPVEIPLNFPLPAGYRLYVTLGTTVATGYTITTIGGKY
jgi:hypothetical protein